MRYILVSVLLLLSLSEHIGFGASYLIAALANVGLLVVYLCSVLKGFGRGLLFGGLLSLLYAALFALLQSEDHALLAGSVLVPLEVPLKRVAAPNPSWRRRGGEAAPAEEGVFYLERLAVRPSRRRRGHGSSIQFFEEPFGCVER